MSGKLKKSRKRKLNFQYLRRKFPKKMQKKLVMLFMAIILAFVFLIGRITYINASSGDKYTKVVLDQQQYDSRTIPFRRGDIIDRNGTKVATSERVYNVILDAKVMTDKEKYIEPTKKVLEECFGIPENEVDEVLEKNPEGRYNIMLKGIPYEKAKEFEAIDEDDDKYPNVQGIWLEQDYIRTYPYNTLASDVIGFTVDGNVGSAGLEAAYNTILNGTDGREYGYLDAGSAFEQVVKESVDGRTIVSTIDTTLQEIVERHIFEFNQAHENQNTPGPGSKNTAVIMANPNNGEILAMASYPNFDLNNPRDLSQFFSEEELKEMSDEEKVEQLNQLWRNFCVNDTIELGSTMKPFTVAAGLETGKINGSEVYVCGGMLHVGDHNVQCHFRAGHGPQTVEQSIANSCNVALMHIAATIGADEFCKYQRIFGFGEYTNIDLPGEAETSGLLYTAENMGEADLATNSFGQGFNASLIQLVAGFSSLINGGNYYEPHIVKQIQDSNGNVLENIDPVLVKKTISEETSTTIKQYMKAVMDYGTGQNAQVEGYDIGGKTGTAEKLPRDNGKHTLSFAGYAPQDKPEILIYVVIDEPNVPNQATSAYVTELSQKLMQETFAYLNITKIDTTTEETIE